jgi:glycosyltransferase involved in cell wall biosynthesis
MRILIALTYYRPHYSGLTIYAEHEARALVARGHQVTILTSRYDKALKAHEFREGVEVIRPRVWFHLSKGVIMPAIPFWAWKLVRQADVVHLHVPQLDAALISIICRLLHKPVVLTYHCDLRLPKGLVHKIANRVSDLANAITATLADIVVTNTRDYAESSAFLRRFLHKLVPILPPVQVEQVSASDLEAFKRKFNIQPGQRIIGIAARLATEKGVEYLVQALPAVLERHPSARVLVVGPYQNVIGEEEYASRIMSIVGSLGEHWSFLGVVTPVELAAFFHESEVTVLPSLNSTESFGMVQVEALACGAPLIASDLPGMRVPVRMTGSGLLVPPANPVQLARALITVLDEPERYRGQPEKLVSLSTPENVAQEYEKLFDLVRDRKLLQATLAAMADHPIDPTV